MSTMLTRASARARLAKRVMIGKLPEDVLLEIFDAYRQDMEPEPCYENIWNGRNHGWFKLAHVCQRWRRVVFSSPSLLHVHLLFTPHRSPRMAMLKLLPLFPILIDHRASSESWRVKTDNLALAAIKYRSRVRGSTLRRPYTDIEKFLTALSYPFPELESLEICSPNSRDRALDLPSTFLWSAPCLRRLTLRELAPRCLSPLLSSATGLVELALTLRVSCSKLPEASLLTNLQRMSCLRRLELNVVYWFYRDLDTAGPPPPASAGDVVPLSRLTHLIFSGNGLYLLELVVGLAAPSLQHLDADLNGWLHGPFHIPRLCRFIRETECQFTAIRLDFSYQKLTFHAGMGSRPVDDQPFKIKFPGHYPLPQMGQELSGPLSTVEELIVEGDVEEWYTGHLIRMDQWRGFCYHVPQVKTVQVRVSAKLALDVAHSFQQDGEPIPNFFPALERVEVLSVAGRDDLICDAFEPLITARQREGRPVRLSWILVEE